MRSRLNLISCSSSCGTIETTKTSRHRAASSRAAYRLVATDAAGSPGCGWVAILTTWPSITASSTVLGGSSWNSGRFRSTPPLALFLLRLFAFLALFALVIFAFLALCALSSSRFWRSVRLSSSRFWRCSRFSSLR